MLSCKSTRTLSSRVVFSGAISLCRSALLSRLTQSLCFYTHSVASAWFIIYQLKIMRVLCCSGLWGSRGGSLLGGHLFVCVCEWVLVCIAMCHLFMLLSSHRRRRRRWLPSWADRWWPMEMLLHFQISDGESISRVRPVLWPGSSLLSKSAAVRQSRLLAAVCFASKCKLQLQLQLQFSTCRSLSREFHFVKRSYILNNFFFRFSH